MAWTLEPNMVKVHLRKTLAVFKYSFDNYYEGLEIKIFHSSTVLSGDYIGKVPIHSWHLVRYWVSADSGNVFIYYTKINLISLDALKNQTAKNKLNLQKILIFTISRLNVIKSNI